MSTTPTVKFTFRLFPSVWEQVEQQALAAKTSGYTSGGRRVSREAVVQAIFLQFFTLPEAERDAAIRKQLVRLDALAAASNDPPAPASKPATRSVDATAETLKSSPAGARKGGRRPAG